MTSQIFKKPIPASILWDFIKNNCQDMPEYCIITRINFKQAEYHNTLPVFLSSLKEYYLPSKQYYIGRKVDYSKFITIIRQICNYNNIAFTSKVVYNKSEYEILYYVYK